ncbi:hypothetical protein FHT76_007600 [Rhizobium sp. BK176]|nr:hypothetical protein [Rhizobium sp. BK176]
MVMRGASNDLSLITLRPFGPSTLTAFESTSTHAAYVQARRRGVRLLSQPCLQLLRRLSLLRVGLDDPMTSLCFMISRSSPRILILVPDHLPNRIRSPALTSSAWIWPASLRSLGPTVKTSPSCWETQPNSPNETCHLRLQPAEPPLSLPYRCIIDLLLAELCSPRDWHRALSELPFQI